MKRILLFFFFLFGFFLTSYGSAQNINNDEFKLYIPEKPYINAYSKFEFIEKGKILVEYDKSYYEALIKAYSGKDVLFWENTGEIKTEIKYDGDKVHIIFHKGDVIDKYLQYHLNIFDEYLYLKKENNSNWWNFCNNSKITQIIGKSEILSCYLDSAFMSIYTRFDFLDNVDKKNILISLINRDYKSLGEILNEIHYNEYNEKVFSNNHINLIKFAEHDYMNLYNNYLDTRQNRYIFHIEENKEDLYNYITDTIFYRLIGGRNNSFPFGFNNGNLYINKNNDLFYIGDKDDYYIIGIGFTFENKYHDIFCDSYGNICRIQETGEEISIDILKDNISIIDEKIYFNISKFITDIQKQGYFKGVSLEDIVNIGINGDSYYFPYINLPMNLKKNLNIILIILERNGKK